MTVNAINNCSWMLKHISQIRSNLHNNMVWEKMKQEGKFNMKRMYHQSLKDDGHDVEWKRIFAGNLAKPRA